MKITMTERELNEIIRRAKDLGDANAHLRRVMNEKSDADRVKTAEHVISICECRLETMLDKVNK